MPVIRRLLVDGADDAGLVVAVGDAHGRLLWVEGDTDLRRRAEDMLFIAGADWSRSGSAPAHPARPELDRAVQILGAEHYNRIVHPWSCTAAPVHDPATGAVLGVIDITGTDLAVAPHALSLVSATVAAVERSCGSRSSPAVRAPSAGRACAPSRLRRARSASRCSASGVLRLGAHGAQSPARRDPRPARMEPRGIGAERLAALLYERDASPVTLRAEIVRLRRMLQAAGEPALESRPYRLGRELDLDAGPSPSSRAGRARKAVERYPGPVLPASTALRHRRAARGSRGPPPGVAAADGVARSAAGVRRTRRAPVRRRGLARCSSSCRRDRRRRASIAGLEDRHGPRAHRRGDALTATSSQPSGTWAATPARLRLSANAPLAEGLDERHEETR